MRFPNLSTLLPDGLTGMGRVEKFGPQPSDSMNSDLVSFRPTVAVQKSLQSRDSSFRLQPIESGRGNVNLDRYEVHITRLPMREGQQMTPAQFLQVVRIHFDDLMDTNVARFHPFSGADALIFASSNPIGAITQFDLLPGKLNLGTGWDDGSVLVTAATPTSWIFSTIHTWADLDHPVAGNREFGISPNADGSWTFYTRAADRTQGRIDLFLQTEIFNGGDSTWRGLQKGIVALVKVLDGAAYEGPRVSARHDWDIVKAKYFHPESLVPHTLESVRLTNQSKSVMPPKTVPPRPIESQKRLTLPAQTFGPKHAQPQRTLAAPPRALSKHPMPTLPSHRRSQPIQVEKPKNKLRVTPEPPRHRREAGGLGPSSPFGLLNPMNPNSPLSLLNPMNPNSPLNINRLFTMNKVLNANNHSSTLHTRGPSTMRHGGQATLPHRRGAEAFVRRGDGRQIGNFEAGLPKPHPHHSGVRAETGRRPPLNQTGNITLGPVQIYGPNMARRTIPNSVIPVGRVTTRR